MPLDDSHSRNSAVVPSSSETVKVLKLSWFADSLAAGALLPENDYLLYTGKKLPPAAADTSSPKQVRVEPGTPTKIIRSSLGQAAHRTSPAQPPPKLVRETTSEHSIPLPPIPDFLQTTYSCQRPTPVNPPNGDFIEELKAVRTLRILQGDQVGVRAYSSSIASLAAYPFALQTPGGRFLSSLPCLEYAVWC
jgi:DNA polymerase IV